MVVEIEWGGAFSMSHFEREFSVLSRKVCFGERLMRKSN